MNTTVAGGLFNNIGGRDPEEDYSQKIECLLYHWLNLYQLELYYCWLFNQFWNILWKLLGLSLLDLHISWNVVCDNIQIIVFSLLITRYFVNWTVLFVSVFGQ